MKVAWMIYLLFFFFAVQQSRAQFYYYDSVSFETPTAKIFIDTGATNIWQIGHPGKTIFNGAYSGSNAIVTDTMNSYPPNDTSSFIYGISKIYTQTCVTCIEFWHKYDMDTLGDKGIIEASYDGGNSWLNLRDTFEYFIFYWEPDSSEVDGSYSTHPAVINGRSEGWIKSKFCWEWWIAVKNDTIITNPDSLMIRFTFISDSVVKSNEGWMIDNILTSALLPQYCLGGLNEDSNSGKISVSPNPFSDQTMLNSDRSLSDATLYVVNSYGSEVMKIKHICGQNIIVSRDNLSAGLYYFILIQNNNTFATGKLIVVE